MVIGLQTVPIKFFTVQIVEGLKIHIVLNSGPIVTFRADNVVLNFKDFSIREIAAATDCMKIHK